MIERRPALSARPSLTIGFLSDRIFLSSSVLSDPSVSLSPVTPQHRQHRLLQKAGKPALCHSTSVAASMSNVFAIPGTPRSRLAPLAPFLTQPLPLTPGDSVFHLHAGIARDKRDCVDSAGVLEADPGPGSRSVGVQEASTSGESIVGLQRESPDLSRRRYGWALLLD